MLHNDHSVRPATTAPEIPSRHPVTLPSLAEKKRRGEPIVMVTAYDYPSAQAVEDVSVDLVLAGDTSAEVVLGYPATSRVSLEEMLHMTAAVRRGLRTPLLIGDLPGRRHRSAVRQGGGSGRGQARARRNLSPTRAGHRASGHSGDGTRGRHPTDRGHARRQARPRPDGGAGTRAIERGTDAPGGRLLRDRARSGPSPGGRDDLGPA